MNALPFIPRLFEKEAVREGDIYLSPIGGYSIQVLRVEEVTSACFRSRNQGYVDVQTFNEPLNGILLREEEGRLVAYVSRHTLGTLQELCAEGKAGASAQ